MRDHAERREHVHESKEGLGGLVRSTGIQAIERAPIHHDGGSQVAEYTRQPSRTSITAEAAGSSSLGRTCLSVLRTHTRETGETRQSEERTHFYFSTQSAVWQSCPDFTSFTKMGPTVPTR